MVLVAFGTARPGSKLGSAFDTRDGCWRAPFVRMQALWLLAVWTAPSGFGNLLPTNRSDLRFGTTKLFMAPFSAQTDSLWFLAAWIRRLASGTYPCPPK